jgi:prevent-host-death family protein
MAEVSVHEAKKHLSRLLLRVARGEEIEIAHAGKPVAKLVPIEPKPQRVFGQDEGLPSSRSAKYERSASTCTRGT